MDNSIHGTNISFVRDTIFAQNQTEKKKMI